MEERFLRVPRTARYHLLGDPVRAERIWMVLHGYGQLARFFLNKFEGMEKDMCIVAPEGLSRFYLDAAHERVGATWMTREDRKHEIVDHIEYLDRLVLELQHNANKEPSLGVFGFSQGVATTCRWAMHGRSRIERMVLWGGSMPPELEPAAMQEAWKDVTVEVIHGARDPLVPLSVSERNAARLSEAGVDQRMTVFEGGHELEPVTLGRCLAR